MRTSHVGQGHLAFRTRNVLNGPTVGRHDRQRPPWEPPVAGTDLEHLVGALDCLRMTFRWKADDLDAAGLQTRIGASTLTLGGLLKHLAAAEDMKLLVCDEHAGVEDWRVVACGACAYFRTGSFATSGQERKFVGGFGWPSPRPGEPVCRVFAAVAPFGPLPGGRPDAVHRKTPSTAPPAAPQ